jgi:hypothetical protein
MEVEDAFFSIVSVELFLFLTLPPNLFNPYSCLFRMTCVGQCMDLINILDDTDVKDNQMLIPSNKLGRKRSVRSLLLGIFGQILFWS